MTICINLDTADVPYTFIGPRSTSRFDHCLASPAMGGSVVSCNIIHNNLYSDHVLLCVSFNINIDHTIQVDRTPDSKTAWCKAGDDQKIQYKHVLQDKLSKIRYDSDIFWCTDIHCIKHLIDLLEFYHNIIHSCIDA